MLRRHAHRLRRVLAASTVVLTCAALALPAIGSDGTEFLCEEAVAHIASCCPRFDPETVRCSYTITCSKTDNPNPDFTADQSRCIERMGCDALQTTAICEGENPTGSFPC